MLFQRINGGQDFDKLRLVWVHPHHKLTDQSESISHYLDPFWPAESLFNVASTKICSHLSRYDSDPLVNFMCCTDMAISTDTLPLEMLCHIFSFLGADILLVCWNVSRLWHLVITQQSCWQKEVVWLQISNLEISHADTPSAENYLREVLHLNSEKLRTIRSLKLRLICDFLEFWLNTIFRTSVFPCSQWLVCRELLSTLSRSLEQ